MKENIINSKWKTACLLCMILAIFSIPAWGDNSLPPSPENEPIVVHVALVILDVDEISDNDQNFTVNLFGRFRWTDPRLAHDGPGNISRKLEEVWNPRLLFLNIQRTWSYLPKVVEIKPSGEVLHRIHLWGNFSQPLNLRNYPFDRHLFKIPIVAGYATDKLIVRVDPETIPYVAEKLSVADWDISNFHGESKELKLSSHYTHNSVVYSFEGVRRSENIIIKVIIPLILIVLMSWTVFWIDPQQSGSQLAMSMTSVLTLIAYHIALGSKLPEIPYMTRLDVFVFGSTIIVFVSLIEVVITSRLSTNDRLNRARKIDMICKWLFPIVFTLIAVYSFVLRS